jgi:hypothetical protein
MLTLEQYKEENKLAKIFTKYGGYVIIPIIVMQFTAMYIRISNYGLTSARYVSLALNILAVIFAIVSLIKSGKYIKQTLLDAIFVALFLTISPMNLQDVPVFEQTWRLTRVLNQNGMIENGSIVAKEDIPHEDKITITSAYNYINRYAKGERIPDVIRYTYREDLLSNDNP